VGGAGYSPINGGALGMTLGNSALRVDMLCWCCTIFWASCSLRAFSSASLLSNSFLLASSSSFYKTEVKIAFIVTEL